MRDVFAKIKPDITKAKKLAADGDFVGAATALGWAKDSLIQAGEFQTSIGASVEALLRVMIERAQASEATQ